MTAVEHLRSISSPLWQELLFDVTSEKERSFLSTDMFRVIVPDVRWSSPESTHRFFLSPGQLTKKIDEQKTFWTRFLQRHAMNPKRHRMLETDLEMIAEKFLTEMEEDVEDPSFDLRQELMNHSSILIRTLSRFLPLLCPVPENQEIVIENSIYQTKTISYTKLQLVDYLALEKRMMKLSFVKPKVQPFYMVNELQKTKPFIALAEDQQEDLHDRVGQYHGLFGPSLFQQFYRIMEGDPAAVVTFLPILQSLVPCFILLKTMMLLGRPMGCIRASNIVQYIPEEEIEYITTVIRDEPHRVERRFEDVPCSRQELRRMMNNKQYNEANNTFQWNPSKQVHGWFTFLQYTEPVSYRFGVDVSAKWSMAEDLALLQAVRALGKGELDWETSQDYSVTQTTFDIPYTTGATAADVQWEQWKDRILRSFVSNAVFTRHFSTDPLSFPFYFHVHNGQTIPQIDTARYRHEAFWKDVADQCRLDALAMSQLPALSLLQQRYPEITRAMTHFLDEVLHIQVLLNPAEGELSKDFRRKLPSTSPLLQKVDKVLYLEEWPLAHQLLSAALIEGENETSSSFQWKQQLKIDAYATGTILLRLLMLYGNLVSKRSVSHLLLCQLVIMICFFPGPLDIVAYQSMLQEFFIGNNIHTKWNNLKWSVDSLQGDRLIRMYQEAIRMVKLRVQLVRSFYQHAPYLQGLTLLTHDVARRTVIHFLDITKDKVLKQGNEGISLTQQVVAHLLTSKRKRIDQEELVANIEKAAEVHDALLQEESAAKKAWSTSTSTLAAVASKNDIDTKQLQRKIQEKRFADHELPMSLIPAHCLTIGPAHSIRLDHVLDDQLLYLVFYQVLAPFFYNPYEHSASTMEYLHNAARGQEVREKGPFLHHSSESLAILSQGIKVDYDRLMYFMQIERQILPESVRYLLYDIVRAPTTVETSLRKWKTTPLHQEKALSSSIGLLLNALSESNKLQFNWAIYRNTGTTYQMLSYKDTNTTELSRHVSYLLETSMDSSKSFIARWKLSFLYRREELANQPWFDWSPSKELAFLSLTHLRRAPRLQMHSDRFLNNIRMVFPVQTAWQTTYPFPEMEIGRMYTMPHQRLTPNARQNIPMTLPSLVHYILEHVYFVDKETDRNTLVDLFRISLAAATVTESVWFALGKLFDRPLILLRMYSTKDDPERLQRFPVPIRWSNCQPSYFEGKREYVKVPINVVVDSDQCIQGLLFPDCFFSLFSVRDKLVSRVDLAKIAAEYRLEFDVLTPQLQEAARSIKKGGAKWIPKLGGVKRILVNPVSRHGKRPTSATTSTTLATDDPDSLHALHSVPKSDFAASMIPFTQEKWYRPKEFLPLYFSSFAGAYDRTALQERKHEYNPDGFQWTYHEYMFRFHQSWGWEQEWWNEVMKQTGTAPVYAQTKQFLETFPQPPSAIHTNFALTTVLYCTLWQVSSAVVPSRCRLPCTERSMKKYMSAADWIQSYWVEEPAVTEGIKEWVDFQKKANPAFHFPMLVDPAWANMLSSLLMELYITKERDSLQLLHHFFGTMFHYYLHSIANKCIQDVKWDNYRTTLSSEFQQLLDDAPSLDWKYKAVRVTMRWINLTESQKKIELVSMQRPINVACRDYLVHATVADKSKATDFCSKHLVFREIAFVEETLYPPFRSFLVNSFLEEMSRQTLPTETKATYIEKTARHLGFYSAANSGTALILPLLYFQAMVGISLSPTKSASATNLEELVVYINDPDTWLPKLSELSKPGETVTTNDFPVVKWKSNTLPWKAEKITDRSKQLATILQTWKENTLPWLVWQEEANSSFAFEEMTKIIKTFTSIVDFETPARTSSTILDSAVENRFFLNFIQAMKMVCSMKDAPAFYLQSLSSKEATFPFMLFQLVLNQADREEEKKKQKKSNNHKFQGTLVARTIQRMHDDVPYAQRTILESWASKWTSEERIIQATHLTWRQWCSVVNGSFPLGNQSSFSQEFNKAAFSKTDHFDCLIQLPLFYGFWNFLWQNKASYLQIHQGTKVEINWSPELLTKIQEVLQKELAVVEKPTEVVIDKEYIQWMIQRNQHTLLSIHLENVSKTGMLNDVSNLRTFVQEDMGMVVQYLGFRRSLYNQTSGWPEGISEKFQKENVTEPLSSVQWLHQWMKTRKAEPIYLPKLDEHLVKNAAATQGWKTSFLLPVEELETTNNLFLSSRSTATNPPPSTVPTTAVAPVSTSLFPAPAAPLPTLGDGLADDPGSIELRGLYAKFLKMQWVWRMLSLDHVSLEWMNQASISSLQQLFPYLDDYYPSDEEMVPILTYLEEERKNPTVPEPGTEKEQLLLFQLKLLHSAQLIHKLSKENVGSNPPSTIAEWLLYGTFQTSFFGIHFSPEEAARWQSVVSNPDREFDANVALQVSEMTRQILKDKNLALFFCPHPAAATTPFLFQPTDSYYIRQEIESIMNILHWNNISLRSSWTSFLSTCDRAKQSFVDITDKGGYYTGMMMLILLGSASILSGVLSPVGFYFMSESGQQRIRKSVLVLYPIAHVARLSLFYLVCGSTILVSASIVPFVLLEQACGKPLHRLLQASTPAKAFACLNEFTSRAGQWTQNWGTAIRQGWTQLLQQQRRNDTNAPGQEVPVPASTINSSPPQSYQENYASRWNTFVPPSSTPIPPAPAPAPTPTPAPASSILPTPSPTPASAPPQEESRKQFEWLGLLFSSKAATHNGLVLHPDRTVGHTDPIPIGQMQDTHGQPRSLSIADIMQTDSMFLFQHHPLSSKHSKFIQDKQEEINDKY
jgi:hypothetical protein